MGTIPLSVLFALAFILLVEIFSRHFDSWRAAWFPHDMLLLPQSLLSRFFSRPTCLRRRRTRIAKELHGRTPISLYSPKRPSLLSLSRHPFLVLSLVRRF